MSLFSSVFAFRGRIFLVDFVTCVFNFEYFQGVISDKALMEKLLREHEIEVVISAVGGTTILDQIILVEAIQAVGTIKVYTYITKP